MPNNSRAQVANYIDAKKSRQTLELALDRANLNEQEALVNLLNQEYPDKIEFAFHGGTMKFLYQGFILRNKKCSIQLSFPHSPQTINYLAISDYDSPLLKTLRRN